MLVPTLFTRNVCVCFGLWLSGLLQWLLLEGARSTHTKQGHSGGHGSSHWREDIFSLWIYIIHLMLLKTKESSKYRTVYSKLFNGAATHRPAVVCLVVLDDLCFWSLLLRSLLKTCVSIFVNSFYFQSFLNGVFSTFSSSRSDSLFIAFFPTPSWSLSPACWRPV